MFAARFILAVVPFIGFVLAAPTDASARDEDWKTKLGWDGKVTTPVELDPSNVSKASDGALHVNVLSGGVYFCTDANFQGNCIYVSNFSSGQCVGVGSNFNDDVTSFGPDKGLTCTVYSDAGCSGRATGGIVYPGISNLADYNNNDAMSSFKCT